MSAQVSTMARHPWLWNPATYCHPWSTLAMTSGQRMGVNRYLIRKHHLAMPAPVGPDQRPLVDMMTAAWERLDRMAFLLGCFVARPHLLAHRHWVTLDRDARAFLLGCLPAAGATHTIGGGPVVEAVGALGRQRMHALAGKLPAWLGDRLALRFADPGRGLPWTTCDAAGLWSASRHAAKTA